MGPFLFFFFQQENDYITRRWKLRSVLCVMFRPRRIPDGVRAGGCASYCVPARNAESPYV